MAALIYCRGWSEQCGAPATYWLKWSYEGARQFPSVHPMCARCATKAEGWIRHLAEERMTDLQYDWRPLITGEEWQELWETKPA